MSAAAEAGFRIIRLVEHTDLSHDLRTDTLVQEPDGRYRRRVDGHPLPVLFTLIAALDAARGDRRP